MARLSVDQGLGAETLYRAASRRRSRLSGTPVAFPVGGFLQATEDGEAALAAAVREAVERRAIADLFAGLGTFALAVRASLCSRSLARCSAGAQAGRAASRSSIATSTGGRSTTSELAPFDAVILDPPRAGAEEQVRALAASAVQRIAYVSCNPATFARDARTLVDGGYALDWVKPVGQFRWSTHVELAAAFSR